MADEVDKSSDLLNVLREKFGNNKHGILSCYTVMLDVNIDPSNDIFKHLCTDTKSPPILSGICRLTDHVHKTNRAILLHGNHLYLTFSEKKLPDALYLICFTPLESVNEQSVMAAKKEIKTHMGLLRLVHGNGIAKQLVFECLLDLNTGEKKELDLVLLLHKEFDGPDLSNFAFNDFNDLKLSLINADPAIKAQILSAIHLAEEAAICKHNEYKFMLYFISLEALFGESWRVGAFIIKISEHYKCTKSFVKKNLMFITIWKLRVDAFHRGKMIYLNQEFEKYLQLLILDLIRAFLKLPCKKLAQAFKETTVVNLDYVIVEIPLPEGL